MAFLNVTNRVSEFNLTACEKTWLDFNSSVCVRAQKCTEFVKLTVVARFLHLW